MPEQVHKFCLNHTERPAISRCAVCLKPICEECIIVTDGVDTCSDLCSTNYSNSEGVRIGLEEKAESDRRKKKKQTISSIITVIILVILAIFYWKHREAINEKALDIKGAAEEAAGKAVGAGEDLLDKARK